MRNEHRHQYATVIFMLSQVNDQNCEKFKELPQNLQEKTQ